MRDIFSKYYLLWALFCGLSFHYTAEAYTMKLIIVNKSPYAIKVIEQNQRPDYVDPGIYSPSSRTSYKNNIPEQKLQYIPQLDLSMPIIGTFNFKDLSVKLCDGELSYKVDSNNHTFDATKYTIRGPVSQSGGPEGFKGYQCKLKSYYADIDKELFIILSIEPEDSEFRCIIPN